MRARVLVLILAVLASAALAGCDPRSSGPSTAPGAPVVGAAPSSQPAPRVTQKDELLDMLNADRAAAGLPPFTLRAGVAQTAREWAAHMAGEGRLSHHPDLRAALARWGVVGWSAAGENVGVAGHVSQVHHNFMGSPGHRASILSPSFSEVGIGVTASGGQVWVVIDFVG